MRFGLKAFIWAILTAKLIKRAETATTDRIVLREDQRFCIARSGTNIELQRCSGSNSNQEWDFGSGSKWKSASNSNQCVIINSVSNAATLFLDDCTANNVYRNWDDNSDQTIRPTDNDDYCITYDSSDPGGGDAIETVNCSPTNTDIDKEWAITRYQMVVLDSNTNYCIGPSGSISNGVYLELQGCNDSDNNQLWQLVDGGSWRPYNNNNLCIDIDNSGRLRLQTCNDDRDKQTWYRTGSSQVRNANWAQCVGHETSTADSGDDIELIDCISSDDNQLWDFENKEDYSATSDAFEMLVLRTNVDYCIGLHNGVATSGTRLELALCDENDDAFYWNFASNRLLKPKEDDNLCAEIDALEEGEQVHLKPCSTSNGDQQFNYNSGDEEIRPDAELTTCLSFLGNTNNDGKPIVLDECRNNDRQIWARTEKFDYPPSEYSSQSTTNANQLLVLDENDEFCVTVTSTNENGLLKLAQCNSQDDKQLWTLSNTGKFYPKLNDGVCVDAPSISSGQDLYLQECSNSNDDLWNYDTNTIEAGTTNLCITYSASSPTVAVDDVIELTNCANSGVATWTFFDPVVYDSDVAGRSFDNVHIVSVEDDGKCLGVSSATDNADVLYTNCNLNDARQNWATNDLGQMYLKDYTNLCVELASYSQNTDVKLTTCNSSRQYQQFVFDGNGDNEITPVITDGLCLTYETSRRRMRGLQFIRRSVTLRGCNGSDAQAWFFD